MQGVGGSNPLAPTNKINELGQPIGWPFSLSDSDTYELAVFKVDISVLAIVDDSRRAHQAVVPLIKQANVMRIPTQPYEAILQRYQAAVRWMKDLGIELGPGRTVHYNRVIQHWTNAYRNATALDGQTIFPDFVSSMFEIHDFIDIHESLQDVPAEHLSSIIEKLRKGVNGPVNAFDETPDSTKARNFLFEAAVAAKSHRPSRGIETLFNAPADTGFSINGKKIWVECKRVTSIEKIETNVRKASSQLETVLNGAVGSGHRGIVALDISKILNRGDQIFVANDDAQLRTSVNRMMDRFIEETHRAWESVYLRRSKKIIGTIIRFSFMSTVEARNILVHTSQWAVNPRIGVSMSDEQILRQIVAVLDEHKI